MDEARYHNLMDSFNMARYWSHYPFKILALPIMVKLIDQCNYQLNYKLN